ncbi:hypothetical protein MKK84_14420 [Methylobacterium sp. E-065]|uniref:hypothetical protein n=1 Tax=Methylobacterium sp. E-065 TaxID=2836583 RepID=UPI001FBC1051|nr:hypothetical protein [Methylobacterium sp. E-065]MCJ2018617.1 hypothetical protein [Methylobacterium sp. E-065]
MFTWLPFFAISAASSAEAEIDGVPKGQVLFYDFGNTGRRIIAFSIETNGKMLPVSANGAAGYERSQQELEMLAMISAAAQKGVSIHISGHFYKKGENSNVDADYVDGNVRADRITVFGYTWGETYLSK